MNESDFAKKSFLKCPHTLMPALLCPHVLALSSPQQTSISERLSNRRMGFTHLSAMCMDTDNTTVRDLAVTYVTEPTTKFSFQYLRAIKTSLNPG
jgi:hypothetical protein